jgi:AcrR family transcriptional regulator
MPRIVDHDAQRAELLAKAFEIFADRGYAATSMRALATGLGVSTGTLYHYFDGKDDIFEQMVLWTSQRDVTDALTVVAGGGAEEPLEAVFSWVRSNETYLQRRILLAFDFKRHRKDAAGRALIEEAAKLYRDTFADIVGSRGAAWSLMVGMLTQGLLQGGGVDFDEHLGVLRGLARLDKS